jgi:hypothetical protein
VRNISDWYILSEIYNCNWNKFFFFFLNSNVLHKYFHYFLRPNSSTNYFFFLLERIICCHWLFICNECGEIWCRRSILKLIFSCRCLSALTAGYINPAVSFFNLNYLFKCGIVCAYEKLTVKLYIELLVSVPVTDNTVRFSSPVSPT